MAIALSNNSLTNLYTVIQYYGADAITPIDLPLATMSGSWLSAINQASEVFHNDVGFPLFSGSLQNERFEGDDASEHYVEFAVEGFSDVYIYDIFYLEGPATTDLVNVTSGSAAYKWQYEADTGLIRFTDGNRFHSHSRDIDNWWIRYHYGLTGPVLAGSAEGKPIPVTTVPEDIQYAVTQEAWRIDQLRRHQGFVSATNEAGISKTYDLNFQSKEYKDTVEKYRRWV
ncbi:hypothetical protein LCGC14_0940660 [marine sediment metagenome]|uniref:Uncharacterized protein n=1 Tax=marine sediment metagenome TaxID=412755 RepID=A0A0F9P6A9_9ZZZZ